MLQNFSHQSDLVEVWCLTLTDPAKIMLKLHQNLCLGQECGIGTQRHRRRQGRFPSAESGGDVVQILAKFFPDQPISTI
ncbi:hypothetical protein OROMI_014898 [Orobanche minor]